MPKPPSALGMSPVGEMCKSCIRGVLNGPSMRPSLISFYFFSGKTLDWLNANVIYFMETGSPGPGYFNLKPIVKPSLSVRATDI